MDKYDESRRLGGPAYLYNFPDSMATHEVQDIRNSRATENCAIGVAVAIMHDVTLVGIEAKANMGLRRPASRFSKGAHHFQESQNTKSWAMNAIKNRQCLRFEKCRWTNDSELKNIQKG